METLRQSALQYDHSLVDPDENSAVRLGIDNLTFQYYHLTVYLTKGDTTQHDICLEAARSAISMLDKLVSNSNQLYNEIVWRLLYQPFTPYFVLFANIISDPRSVHVFTDLQLLRKVVLFFLQMHNNDQSAKRLENVAETFTRLAEAHVRQLLQGTQQTSAREENVVEMQLPMSSATCGASLENAPVTPGSSEPLIPSQQLLSTPLPQTAHPPFNFDALNSAGSSGAALDFEIQQQETLTDYSAWAPAPLVRGLENIAENYGLDGAFDWFSWDQYDAPMA